MPVSEIELQVDQIQFRKDIYPRKNVDQARVADFVELLRSRQPFPKIVVGCKDDQYFLIDGMHRLHAYKELNIRNISCVVDPAKEQFWLLRSAEFCFSSSKPLLKSEKKDVIRRCYLNFNLPEKTIAKRLKVSVSYVYRALKGIRDDKVPPSADDIVAMHEGGATLSEIADSLGISKSSAHFLLKRGQAEIKERARAAEERRQKEAARLKIEPTGAPVVVGLKIAENIQPIEGFSAPRTETPRTEDNTGAAYCSSIQDDLIFLGQDAGDTLVVTEAKSAAEPAANANLEIQVPPLAETVSASLIDHIESFMKLNPIQRSLVFVVSSISDNRSIADIANDLGCTKMFVRSVGFSVLCLYSFRQVDAEAISAKIGIELEQASFIHEMYSLMPNAFPPRRELFSWLKKNASDQSSLAYQRLLRREKIYWRCHDSNLPTPWEKVEDSVVHDLPPSILTFYADVMNTMEQIIASLERYPISKEHAATLLEANNRLLIRINRVTDLSNHHRHGTWAVIQQAAFDV